MKSYERWLDELEDLTDVRNLKIDSEYLYGDLEDTDDKIKYVIQKLRTEYKLLEKKVKASSQDLNSSFENLKRINRERSNRDRNLEAEKKHSGFVVQDSIQHIITFNRIPYYVYKTTVQTPFSTKLSNDEFKAQLIYASDMHDLYIDLGLTYRECNVAYAYDESVKKNINLLFDMLYDRNFKEGYWKVIYYHISPLQEVPDKYQPVYKSPKNHQKG